jgi:hypothetical protein
MRGEIADEGVCLCVYLLPYVCQLALWAAWTTQLLPAPQHLPAPPVMKYLSLEKFIDRLH